MIRRLLKNIFAIIGISIIVAGYFFIRDGISSISIKGNSELSEFDTEYTGEYATLQTIPDTPETADIPFIVVNENIPYFSNEEKTTKVFETYSELDSLGRCGVAYANICKEIMPTEPRGEIGHIKPSGWHTVKYPEVIKDNYLYNRCHLIAFMLAGENDNPKNLITGTRYFNVEGMLPFENIVAEGAKKGLHILYRVTPKYTGNNLVADGVLMEAYSVEDNGKTVQFCVFVNNIQPGVVIDYTTGESHLM